MKVLGIESTCDETAASLVVDGHKILSQIISSQIDLHNVYGGVVPELACRRHIEVILPVIQQALDEANTPLSAIDLIAVAYGPGLVGPLFIGLQTAKGLALALDKPLVGVNHVEAHLYASLMSTKESPVFPALGIVLSGGHTILVKIDAIGSYEPIAHTVDDAVGESFDKVAKMLGKPYPGGPYVESLAKEGSPLRFSFKAGFCKENPLNFSFSGLKTAVMYTLRDHQNSDNPFFHADLCASFQAAAFKDIFNKTERALQMIGSNTLIFGGGVTNNETLRTLFLNKLPHVQQFWPSKSLSLDNASMIAGLGYHVFLQKGPSDLFLLEPKTRIPF